MGDLVKYIRGLEADTLAALNRERAFLVTRAASPDAVLFEPRTEGEALWRIVRANALKTAGAGATQEYAKLGVGLAFNTLNPRVQDYLNEKELVIKTIPKAWHDRLRAELLAGNKAGEPVAEVTRRIESVYGDMQTWQARRIAQTEVVGAYNNGAYSAMVTAEVGKKKWIATLDDKVRDSHARMHGKVVGLKETFPNGLLHPGDPRGRASETINCRCSIQAVVETGAARPATEGHVPAPAVPAKPAGITFPKRPNVSASASNDDVKAAWREKLPTDLKKQRAQLEKAHPGFRLLTDDEVRQYYRVEQLDGMGAPDIEFICPSPREEITAAHLKRLEGMLDEYDARIAAGDPLFAGADPVELSRIGDFTPEKVKELRARQFAQDMRYDLLTTHEKTLKKYGTGWDWVQETRPKAALKAWTEEVAPLVEKVREAGRKPVANLLRVNAERGQTGVARLREEQVIDALSLRTAEEAKPFAERLLASLDTSLVDDKATLKGLSEACEAIARLADEDVIAALERRKVVYLPTDKERASAVRAVPGGRGNAVNVSAKCPAQTHFHELGHHIEYSCVEAGGGEDLHVGSVWRDLTTKQPQSVEKLSNIEGKAGYEANEVARRNDWFNAYVGKVYGTHDEASEVVSMGANLIGEAGARLRWDRWTAVDTSHLEFFIGILRGAHALP